MTKRILAIIPARGGSKGLPRKNVLPLDGKPLIAHTIVAAQQCDLLSDVIVNTDDDEIASVASSYGVQVQRRPEEMGSDSAKVDELLIWSVQKYETDHACKLSVVVLLYPTAPLRPTSAITGTIKQVIEGEFDSCLTLVEDSRYLWKVDSDNGALPTNYDPARRAPRQMESWNQWYENKAVYAVRRDLLLESKCRIGGRIGFFPMSALTSIDIDCRDDLAIAEAIIAQNC